MVDLNLFAGMRFESLLLVVDNTFRHCLLSTGADSHSSRRHSKKMRSFVFAMSPLPTALLHRAPAHNTAFSGR